MIGEYYSSKRFIQFWKYTNRYIYGFVLLIIMKNMLGLDDWTFTLLSSLCFLIIFMLLFKLKPLSAALAEGLIERMTDRTQLQM